MKLVRLFILLVWILLKVNGKQDDGLDLSKVLDTLYNKVEANMIKTIKNKLGGKNSKLQKTKVCAEPKMHQDESCEENEED